MTREQRTSRRNLVLGALGLGAVAFGWQRFGVTEGKLNFVPLPGLDGWSRATSGQLTNAGDATSAVFMGIGTSSVESLPTEQLCSSLYQSNGEGVEIAVFTDFFCPNCRVMDAAFLARDDLNITWHELPLLGRPSELVARAMVAADFQGAYLALKEQLIKTPFRPSLAALKDAANATGIEAERLIADMNGPSVQARLEHNLALAETLAIWGTPAFTIGQKLVLGRISGNQLEALLDQEPSGCKAL